MKLETLNLKHIKAINYRNFDAQYIYRTNIRTATNTREFNCMGYALGSEEWLLPNDMERFENIFYDDEHYEDEEYDENKHPKYGVNYALTASIIAKELAYEYNLKPVERKDMVRGREYIAFRMGPNDFHFILRHKNGTWTHKMGNYPIHKIQEFLVFSNKWGSKPFYDSPIYLFEKPSNHNR